MAHIKVNIDGDNFQQILTYYYNVGDTIELNIQQTSYYIWGLYGILPNIPGCSYESYPGTYGSDIKQLTGTINGTASGYSIGMGRYDKTTGTYTSGGTIILTSVTTYTYYSRLHYNENTGSSAPSDDVVTTSATSKPADRNTSVSGTVPMLTGYKFKGWSKTQYPVGTGTAEYEASDIIGVPYLETDTASVTLYAVWEEEVKKQWVCSIGETRMTPHIFVDGKWVKASIGFKE